MRKVHSVGMIGAVAFLALVWLIGSTSSAGVYDPWCDLDDDGDIDIFDVVKIAGSYGSSGEPYAAKAALAYDSGWVDITDQCGQYVVLEHGLGSMEVMVDLQGRTGLNGGVHQHHLGGTCYRGGWSRTYGDADVDDWAMAVVATVDGGFAVGGSTWPYAAYGGDALLVKTDGNGVRQWTQTYGGGDYERADAVVQTADGGYALAGYTDSFGAGLGDAWLVKTDASGVRQWNYTYGGGDYDSAHAMVQTADGGYALAGVTASFGAGMYDAWLVKTNENGVVQWARAYGGVYDERADSVVQTADGGYALAGYTDSFGAGSRDAWLVKTNADGLMQWQRTYGGAGHDRAYAVVETVDWGYALAGHTDSFGAGLWDAWLVKTNENGVPLWERAYGGVSYDAAFSVVQTGEGGYALGGETGSFGAGFDDAWLVKTDADGVRQWNHTYGGAETEEGASCVVQVGDGGYVLAGYQGPVLHAIDDVLLVKTEVESGLAWTDSTVDTVTLYRGATDAYWNFVRVRIWELKEP